MESVDNFFASLKKPDNMGLLVFLSCALIIWIFSDTIANFFLDSKAATSLAPENIYLYNRASFAINGLLIALIGFVIDVTVTQRTIAGRAQSMAHDLTRDIALSQAQFQTLYENSPLPYFLLDEMGCIGRPNKATLRFFGGTIEVCEQLNLYDMLGEQGKGVGAQSLLREKISRGFPINREEMQIRTIAGQLRWALVSVHVLLNTPTIASRHIVTLVDITEEKEGERAKSDFLLLASHQLRTPMTTIKWYIDYLLHTPSITFAPDVREYLEEIDVGNQRMIDLVGTLLTVSQVEMGTLLPEYAPLSVVELTNDLLRELEPDIKKRNLKVVMTVDKEAVVTSDRNMVRIAVHNLLTNAIKYTKQGGVITVVAENSRARCNISVTDTGCGIALEEQSKIFSRMFRANNARKMSTNGTGLGLHLTRSLVQKLGGTISFNSEENVGTTFTITLPHVAPLA